MSIPGEYKPAHALSVVLILALVVFCACRQQCDRIPVIRIYTDEISWEDKEPAVLAYHSCDHSDSLQVKLKYRGGISRAYWKHSYTVKLPVDMSMAGINAGNDWIVNAGYIDKTFMRHILSFELFREMGSDNFAPQTGFAEVYENDRYEGLYIVMERIDGTRLNLDKSDDAAFNFKEPPLLYEDVGFRDRDSLYRTSQEYPNPDNGDASAPLKELEALIMEADDETFRSQIFDYLDIDNIMDWQLLLLLTNNSDGQHKNYFIYRTGAGNPMRIALWDCDHGLGRDGDNEMNMLERVVNERRMLLFRRLYDTDPNQFNERIRDRWHALRERIFTTENIFGKMAGIEREIAPYLDRNVERWPWKSEWYYDDNTFREEVEIIKEFVPRRLAQLDAQFGYNN